MKYSLILVLTLFSLFTSFASCDKETSGPASNNAENPNGNHNPNPTGGKMKITIGTRTFTATLYDNATASAFKARLPMTVDMSELNGNEKLYRFSTNLPTNDSKPGTITTGDLMIYGSNTLVLFYKTFSTPYSYTRLGRINDTTGLAAAVGSGNVTVIYEL